MTNLSYIPLFRYGAIVRFPLKYSVGYINDFVDSYVGIDEESALITTKAGWHVYECSCQPITLLRFFWWKDDNTRKYRIGLMGWVESIVIPLATIGIFAMSFTPMSAPWAWMVRGIAWFMAGAVIFHTIREHRRMYRPFDSREA